MRYLCISSPGWLPDRGTAVSFSSFLAKLLFYISGYVSIEWPNLVQPLYTYDYRTILPLQPFREWHVDFGVSSVQSSRNFGPLADLAMRVL